jgi:hypothetical protein
LKAAITVIFSICISIFTKCHAQQALCDKLQNLPIASYLNKPMDTILAHLPQGYDTAFDIGPTCNINKGAMLQVYYPNQFLVDIFITDAHFINIHQVISATNPPHVAWPLALLRKEKVGSVIIYDTALNIIKEADIY